MRMRTLAAAVSVGLLAPAAAYADTAAEAEASGGNPFMFLLVIAAATLLGGCIYAMRARRRGSAGGTGATRAAAPAGRPVRKKRPRKKR